MNTISETVYEMAMQRLEIAKPFLRGSYKEIDPLLPRWMESLREKGASECYHKHSTFYDHLTGVYRMLKLWEAPDSVARCALFHSAFSNSNVDLAIFEPDVGRGTVRDLIGEEAEGLVHMFCVVPRKQLIYDNLLFLYTNEELVDGLIESEKAVKDAEDEDLRLPSLNNEENKNASWLQHIEDKVEAIKDEIEDKVDEIFLPAWRKKLQELLPAEGVTVKHIRTGEDLQVPRRLLAIFLIQIMADLSDQRFGYQDMLYDNHDGMYEYKGNNWKSFWPGDCQPGLYHTVASRVCALYNLIVREEKLYMRENRSKEMKKREYENIELVIPPLFNHCTTVLMPSDQILAKDLYWEAMCMPPAEDTLDKAKELLIKSCELNPFIAEPHVLLAQIYNSEENYEEAEKEAEIGLRIMLEWGISWDKRVSWEAWVSWTRVLLTKAKEKSWPQSVMKILSLGLVK